MKLEPLLVFTNEFNFIKDKIITSLIRIEGITIDAFGSNIVYFIWFNMSIYYRIEAINLS